MTPNKKMVYLLDLDANNLYGKPCIYLISHDITVSNVCTQSNTILISTGWAMSQPLPTDGFRWLEKYEIDQMFVKIMELGVNDEKGYILEVDLEMPKDKHDYFNHYPPVTQIVEVTEDMLSNFNIQCMEKL